MLRPEAPGRWWWFYSGLHLEDVDADDGADNRTRGGALVLFGAEHERDRDAWWATRASVVLVVANPRAELHAWRYREARVAAQPVGDARGASSAAGGRAWVQWGDAVARAPPGGDDEGFVYVLGTRRDAADAAAADTVVARARAQDLAALRLGEFEALAAAPGGARAGAPWPPWPLAGARAAAAPPQAERLRPLARRGLELGGGETSLVWSDAARAWRVFFANHSDGERLGAIVALSTSRLDTPFGAAAIVHRAPAARVAPRAAGDEGAWCYAVKAHAALAPLVARPDEPERLAFSYVCRSGYVHRARGRE